MNGGSAVAEAQPEDPDLCIGTPIAVHLEIAPRPPRFRQAGHRGRMLCSAPSVHRKDTSKRCEIHIGERRWYYVCHCERDSHEPKNISKLFTRTPRSEPHFHDIDGACHLCLVIQTVRERFPKMDQKFTAEHVLEQF